MEFPRPLGRSGCVTTSSTACPAASMRSSVGTANCGVPRKMVRIGLRGRHDARSRGLFPFPGFDQLLDLAFDQVPFQRTDVGNEQDSVEVIDLVLHRARQQILASSLEPLAFEILGANRHLLGTAN